MVSPVDPNEVRFTGENSFIRLHQEEGGAETTRASHWRSLLSPAGQGHVLFLRGEVTSDQVRIYSDNIALARWLQEEIEGLIFPDFADQTFPVTEAVFSRSGDASSFWNETIESEDESVSLTWYDFTDPIMLRVEAGSIPGRPHGVYSCFVPARRAQLTLNGLVASGRPNPALRDDRTSSTAVLAWSETWVRPASS